jgi:hypothetical protein
LAASVVDWNFVRSTKPRGPDFLQVIDGEPSEWKSAALQNQDTRGSDAYEGHLQHGILAHSSRLEFRSINQAKKARLSSSG